MAMSSQASVHRSSSATSLSTRDSHDSWTSTDTVKDHGSLFKGPRRGKPMQIQTDTVDRFDAEAQISPTSGGPSQHASVVSSQPHASVPEKSTSGMADLVNYRRDLAVLETVGGRAPPIQPNPPTTNQIAPWMSSSGGNAALFSGSNDSLSQTPQLSPPFGRGPTSPSDVESHYRDERRPSATSIATASSSGSKSSFTRDRIHKKLHNFFGDDPHAKEGRDGSDSSLHSRDRTNSFPRSHRDRNGSTATETGARDTSPASSRPRTPVPSSDVVPFLYQDAEDISLYGEAPVRTSLSGPDRERYNSLFSSKSTSRSGHSSHGHHGPQIHRHKRSKDETSDARSLRPSVSREDTGPSPRLKERGSTSMATGTANSSSKTLPPRPHSPSSLSGYDAGFGGPGHAGATWPQPSDGTHSPPNNIAHNKRGLLGRFRKKERDTSISRLRDLSASDRSLTNSSNSRADSMSVAPAASLGTRTYISSNPGSEVNLIRNDYGNFVKPRENTRQGTFTKFRKGRSGTKNDDVDSYEPQSKRNNHNHNVNHGSVFSLDTNLSDMDGILSTRPQLAPLDSQLSMGNGDDESRADADASGGAPNWNAPDSWAVKKVHEDTMSPLPEADESMVSQQQDEAGVTPYCIRIFRTDGTFSTMAIPLRATVTDVTTLLNKKGFILDNKGAHQIVMKKHDLQRVLGNLERPAIIQKRLLEQAGYESRDKIEDVGREDNSYLCRFSYVPALGSTYATLTPDPTVQKNQKYSHVDLSGRNLVTIPISLYSKASEFISLNLSRNLSLDIPKDFIQSCTNLRDIKYNNNEAWKLPSSLSRAVKLTILDVSNNRIDNLEHAELSRLQGLISLKLANNRLRSLPPYFGQFKSMRTLNLSSNFLDTFPDFLCNLDGLVDIDMSFNSIASLPDEIGRLKSLERFVITNNRLASSLPANFSKLKNLKEVDVRYNNLTSIEVIAHLPKVEQISADHNNVSTCEASFSNIRILRLNSNPVTKFDILNPVPTLTTLVLSNAKLASLPDAIFDKMPNVVKLVLDNNHFVSLPINIGKLRKLEHFSIARNALSSLPAEIGCLTELRFLDVRQNNLKKLPMEIWWANKLETLNVSSNVMDNFPKPASRPPQIPGDFFPTTFEPNNTNGSLSHSTSFEELGPLEAFTQRRPSQNPSSLLAMGSNSSVGLNRKDSAASIYAKNRKQSMQSRNGSQSTVETSTTRSSNRKDSSLSTKTANTFAGSLRNLMLADNELDDDIFDEITMLSEIRTLNLSYNQLTDIPHRSIKSWPQLSELYLSGNELTSLPSDDFEEFSLLQVLHINGNKFQTLPAELGKAHRLAVLDVGSNSLKYNVSNWPYDWNWNWNINLKYLNFSGNQRLEIKPSLPGGSGARDGQDLTNFNALQHLRILGLMDVTLTIPTIPDQTDDRRVRTSGSIAGQLAYGMADTMGKNEHLSIIDLVVPRYNSKDTETLIGMFDGQALSSGGSKIAKYLHENFGRIFSEELKKMNTDAKETPTDALRRAFLSLNKDLATMATQQIEERPLIAHRGSTAPGSVLAPADLTSGATATVMFLQQSELYVANVGDVQAMLIHSEGGHRILTRKHDPAEPIERQRIRDAGGWVSRQGKLNDVLEVSRAFGYAHIMPSVQAAPHVMHITVKEQDEMIVIASRELWEYLTPDLVVDVARSEHGDMMCAAARLRDYAIAFGASQKLMVMIVGVSNLKKRAQMRAQLKPQRVQSISFNPRLIDQGYLTGAAPKRRKKGDATVDDSSLRRLPDEIEAPVGDIALVFTDIKSSTFLWETYSSAMRSAIKLHNDVMRRQLRLIGGYEVKTEGDAFMVSFPTATSALLWCFSVQSQLLEVEWPAEVLSSLLGQEVYDDDGTLIFRGLSVRMGIHWGAPLCENDPITRRMDYFGPIVNRAARVSAVADGGQISVSADFISEIQRCLETYSDSGRSNSVTSEDAFEEIDIHGPSIRRDLESLSNQGFEIRVLGERKLKGLENPEYIWLMYPHVLAGRIPFMQPADAEPEANAADKTAQPQPETAMVSAEPRQHSVDPESVWALWAVSLRLEMLCSSLEDTPGLPVNIKPPEVAILEKVRYRRGDVTDRFLVNLVAHTVTRIESCILTLATRHLAIGKGAKLTSIDQLRAPLDEVLDGLAAQMKELQKYKKKYGELEIDPPTATITAPFEELGLDYWQH